MSTWSSWIGLGSAADKAAKLERVASHKEEVHARAVEALRARLQETEEGRLCGQQLAQGGEFGPDGSASALLSDAYLRRWLVARDWAVDVTYKLLVGHGGWRVHIAPRGYVEEERVRRELDDKKIFMQGVDYEGRALTIIQVRKHFKRDLKETKLFCCYILDNMVNLCDRTRNPRGRLVSMFDMTGCALANLDASTMSALLGMLGVHYVERLSAMYLYNPPGVFWALWNASKALLPEVTRNKIKVIDPKDLSELRACVPPDVLPKEYGGDAELRPIDAACRHFRLPPFHADADAALEVSDAPPPPKAVAAGAGVAAAAAVVVDA
ncbi:MAG: CRAL-TRIO domain-containing protein [Monoraphidium minutum]|nr:MAG: CRAL-TRIO domain-containing protein [Monoraphidium minutum]